MQPQRRQRIKRVIKQLNAERKIQKTKTEILCKDLVNAQKKIVNQIQDFNFTLDFCQRIVGQTSLPKLMSETESVINTYFSHCGIGIFLLQSNGFEFHLSADDDAIEFNLSKIEACFNADLVQKICQSNAICSLDDMFAMSFDSDITLLNKLSVFTIPISGFGPSQGFILLWRKTENPIEKIEIQKLRSAAPILAKAIKSCYEKIETPVKP